MTSDASVVGSRSCSRNSRANNDTAAGTRPGTVPALGAGTGAGAVHVVTRADQVHRVRRDRRRETSGAGAASAPTRDVDVPNRRRLARVHPHPPHAGLTGRTALWLLLVAVSLTVMLNGLVLRSSVVGLQRSAALRALDHRRPADPRHLGDGRAFRRADGRGHADLAARGAARPNGPDRTPGSGVPALTGPVPNLGVTPLTHHPAQQLVANTARQTATERLGLTRRRCRRTGRSGSALPGGHRGSVSEECQAAFCAGAAGDVDLLGVVHASSHSDGEAARVGA